MWDEWDKEVSEWVEANSTWARAIEKITPESIASFRGASTAPFTPDDVFATVVEHKDSSYGNPQFGILLLRDRRFVCLHLKLVRGCDSCDWMDIVSVRTHVSRDCTDLIRFALTREERELLGVRRDW